jgi:hypothetical protein
MEDGMMEVTQLSQIESADSQIKYNEVTVLVASVALAFVFSMAVYFASLSPGTPPGELLSMTVLP